MSSSKHIEDEIKKITWALLQKAGHNPKLTPRLLRQQLEKQMKVQSGSFDKYRKLIKSVIFVWWDQSQDDLGLNSNKQVDDKNAAFALQMLTQLAKAAGKMPGVMKNLPEEPHDRIKALREKLRGMGVECSDIPTVAEIAKAKKLREQQNDMDGIDESQIVSEPRKRKATDSSSGDPEITSKQSNSKEKQSKPLKKSKIVYSDEEAEFDE